MAYVITSPCVGTCDTACVEVCPMDCIAGPIDVAAIRAVPKEERRERFGTVQMFIDGSLCIDCDACASACPVGAPRPEREAPDADREANARFYAERA